MELNPEWKIGQLTIKYRGNSWKPDSDVTCPLCGCKIDRFYLEVHTITHGEKETNGN